MTTPSLTLAVLLALALGGCLPPAAADVESEYRSDTSDTLVDECLDDYFNEACVPECECFGGQYGSVCEAKCCDPVVEMQIDTGHLWTFETDYQCLILCAGPQFTCPAGMVCNTVGPICVWPD